MPVTTAPPTDLSRLDLVARHLVVQHAQLQQRFSFESELIFGIPNHSNHHFICKTF
jgi:hypothetical protein